MPLKQKKNPMGWIYLSTFNMLLSNKLRVIPFINDVNSILKAGSDCIGRLPQAQCLSNRFSGQIY